MTIFSGSPSLQAIRDDMDDDERRLVEEYRELTRLVDLRDEAVEAVEEVKRRAAVVEDELWRAIREARDLDEQVKACLAARTTPRDAF